MRVKSRLPLRRRRVIWIAPLVVAGAAVVVLTTGLFQLADGELEAGWMPVVTVVAGDGVHGTRDGFAIAARFSDPFGIAAAPDGSLYVADAGESQRIRRIDSSGRVSTLAGGDRGYADGMGPSARFDTPSGLALDAAGALYVADTGNNLIRRVAPHGLVSTVAGSGLAGFGDGSADEASFNGPVGIALHPDGRLIVADTYNDRIRAIDIEGGVTTIAGSGRPGALDGAAADAEFHTPCGVAVDAEGNVYVADTGNGLVRRLSRDGVVTTLGGSPGPLLRPIAIAIDERGRLYVGDDRGRIVEISPAGESRVLAGSVPGFADGSGAEARFRGLTGLAVADAGRLLAVDSRNALVRSVAAPSRRDLRPPAPAVVAPRFDAEGFRREPLLWPLAPLEGPFEITGTLGELRGGPGSERFHAGIDVHAAEGTVVRAVRDGVVTSPVANGDFGTLNEWIRVGPVAYVHLRAGRDRRGGVLDTARFAPTYDLDGRISGVRVKRGARFGTGEPIGSTNAFNHVHLNVGWPSEEQNPLHFRLVNFTDTVPPTIARRGVRLLGDDGRPFTERVRGRLAIEGRVHVVVDAWDQVDGNLRRRRLGLYRLGYQVLKKDGTPAPGFETPRTTLRFDRLAAAADAAGVIYASGSGIPFFGRRSTRFFYTVTNTLENGEAAVVGWDTTQLPPGDYTLRILAADYSGNEAIANRDVPVTIAATTVAERPVP